MLIRLLWLALIAAVANVLLRFVRAARRQPRPFQTQGRRQPLEADPGIPANDIIDAEFTDLPAEDDAERP